MSEVDHQSQLPPNQHISTSSSTSSIKSEAHIVREPQQAELNPNYTAIDLVLSSGGRAAPTAAPLINISNNLCPGPAMPQTDGISVEGSGDQHDKENASTNMFPEPCNAGPETDVIIESSLKNVERLAELVKRQDLQTGQADSNAPGDAIDSTVIARPVQGDIDPSQDSTDALAFGKSKSAARATPTAPVMPVERDSEIYNMNHKRRGIAFIFNHMCFDNRLGLKERSGTAADGDNLRKTLLDLEFEVRTFVDLPFKEIERILEECALCEDHSDADCILVSVMSHGELGILYSADQPYKPDRLWSHFNADKCPTLAGKPKMFFIQACQGDQLDGGVHMRRVASKTETDSSGLSYKIPSHADFLIAYSTIPGFYSWRNTAQGSWFIQALCHVLRREGSQRDLLSIMTRVARTVALDFQSNTPGDMYMHEKKQIPCITSMLTRDVIFLPKSRKASAKTSNRRPDMAAFV